MSAKRSKQEAVAPQAQAVAPQAPSDVLVTEVYDCLLQAPRALLTQLLATLVKSCSAAQLERVRAEAAKCGALVATTSWLQTASHRVLDLCFSWLDMHELPAAERVCTRWRSACIDSGAGWRAWLSRGETYLQWLPQMLRLRIRPETLTQCQDVWCGGVSLDTVQHIVRLPAICRLVFRPSINNETVDKCALVARYRGIRHMVVSRAPVLNCLLTRDGGGGGDPSSHVCCAETWESLTFDQAVGPDAHEPLLRLLPAAAPRLQSLALPCDGRLRLEELSALPHLRELTLTLSAMDEPRLGERSAALFGGLAALRQLRVLHISDETRSHGGTMVFMRRILEALGSLTWLRTLRLPDMALETDDALGPLANLTNLETLQLGACLLRGDWVSVVGCRFLSALKGLTHLDGLPRPVTAGGLRLLAQVPQLERLKLHAGGSGGDDWLSDRVEPLRVLRQLRRLELRAFGLDGECCQAWKRAGLELPNAAQSVQLLLSPDDLRTLTALPALSELSLCPGDTPVTRTQLRRLTQTLGPVPPDTD